MYFTIKNVFIMALIVMGIYLLKKQLSHEVALEALKKDNITLTKKLETLKRELELVDGSKKSFGEWFLGWLKSLFSFRNKFN